MSYHTTRTTVVLGAALLLLPVGMLAPKHAQARASECAWGAQVRVDTNYPTHPASAAVNPPTPSCQSHQSHIRIHGPTGLGIDESVDGMKPTTTVYPMFSAWPAEGQPEDPPAPPETHAPARHHHRHCTRRGTRARHRRAVRRHARCRAKTRSRRAHTQQRR
jgi:hypothetical protein